VVFSRVAYKSLTDYRFRGIILAAGLETARARGACFHSLRHTFASEYMRRGGRLYELQQLLGHSTIAQTEKYAHFAPDHLKGLTDKVSFSAPEGRVVMLEKGARGAKSLAPDAPDFAPERFGVRGVRPETVDSMST